MPASRWRKAPSVTIKSTANERNLHVIPREELLTVIRTALCEGDETTVVGAVEAAVTDSIEPRAILSDGLAVGAHRIGLRFGMDEKPASIAALHAGMAALRPYLTRRTNGTDVGTVVIGTVKGNGDDVGKDLAAMMMQAAGFTVHDIGGNNALDDYLRAVETYAPDILGICAFRSWTEPYTRVVVEVVRQERQRDNLVVIVGAPAKNQSTQQIGVDAYCCDPEAILNAAQRFAARRV